MKYLITFPPGALGHFLSRVLSGSYDFRSSPRGSYHELEKTYTSLTINQHSWAKKILPTEVEGIVCAHNFDNRDLRNQYPDHYWIDIQIDGLEEVYLNNFYRKSIQSNANTAREYVEQAQQKFPGHNHALREEYFFLHQHLAKRDLPWLHYRKDVCVIGFKSFYNYNDFVQSIKQIPELPESDYEAIWQDFMLKQQPILTRCQQYHVICDAIKSQQKVEIPHNFDDVDYGIMCAMLYRDTGQDLLNLQNSDWL